MRGRKLVAISGPLLLDLMKQGRVWGEDRILRITDGLPEDAEFVALDYDQFSGQWFVTVASAEWPELQEGAKLERINVVYHTEMLPRWSLVNVNPVRKSDCVSCQIVEEGALPGRDDSIDVSAGKPAMLAKLLRRTS